MCKSSTTSTQGRSPATAQFLLLGFMLTSDFLTSQVPRSQTLRCQHRGLQSAVHFGETRAALQARTRRRSTNKRSSFILYSCTCVLSTRSRPIYLNSGRWRGPTRSKLKVGQQAPKSKWKSSRSVFGAFLELQAQDVQKLDDKHPRPLASNSTMPFAGFHADL